MTLHELLARFFTLFVAASSCYRGKLLVVGLLFSFLFLSRPLRSHIFSHHLFIFYFYRDFSLLGYRVHLFTCSYSFSPFFVCCYRYPAEPRPYIFLFLLSSIHAYTPPTSQVIFPSSSSSSGVFFLFMLKSILDVNEKHYLHGTTQELAGPAFTWLDTYLSWWLGKF